MIYVGPQFTFNKESLVRHRVSVNECLEVVMNPLSVPLTEEIHSSRGNPRELYIGFTFTGRLLEVGVEYMAGDRWHVYHAKRPNSYNRGRAGL